MVEDSGSVPSPSQRPRWSVTAKAVIAVLFLLGAIALIRRVQIIVVPSILALIVAFILNPVVKFFNRWARIPRSLVMALIYLIFVALLAVTIAILTPLLVRQIQNLMVELPVILRGLEQILNRRWVLGPFTLDLSSLLGEAEGLLVNTVQSFGSQSINFLGQVVSGVAEAGITAVYVFIVSFYLVKDGRKAVEWFHGLVPPSYQHDFRHLLAEVSDVWGGFFRGQIVLSLIVSFIVGVVSYVVGLPLALLMGLLAGLLELLPSLGHGIWFTTAVLLALFSGSTWEWMPLSDFWFAVLVAALHIVFQQVDLNLIIPRVIGRRVHLHPAIVIVGILVGASIGGVLGIFLAAPTIASLRVLGRYVHANLFDMDPFPVVSSSTGRDTGAAHGAQDATHDQVVEREAARQT